MLQKSNDPRYQMLSSRASFVAGKEWAAKLGLTPAEGWDLLAADSVESKTARENNGKAKAETLSGNVGLTQSIHGALLINLETGRKGALTLGFLRMNQAVRLPSPK